MRLHVWKQELLEKVILNVLIEVFYFKNWSALKNIQEIMIKKVTPKICDKNCLCKICDSHLTF